LRVCSDWTTRAHIVRNDSKHASFHTFEVTPYKVIEHALKNLRGLIGVRLSMLLAL
jgi:hypothetical protein